MVTSGGAGRAGVYRRCGSCATWYNRLDCCPAGIACFAFVQAARLDGLWFIRICVARSCASRGDVGDSSSNTNLCELASLEVKAWSDDSASSLLPPSLGLSIALLSPREHHLRHLRRLAMLALSNAEYRRRVKELGAKSKPRRDFPLALHQTSDFPDFRSAPRPQLDTPCRHQRDSNRTPLMPADAR